ncbi:Pyridoxal phosphate-dependent transferase major region subdomain 2 [Penicillium brevicompactum]|uniref:Pyridoxal phosphate-dependent transferase major region subdomain 2 n=1 Tax=Penicillium brevicompactum TaxID=5074 RepID=UPI00254211B1|nr:Pyridoxal phosphate-dependent transferase major region subdomain 2 [Penicillium brevicompactum]KAJ5348158.1 Pyridoxal phosphate-dependent transferase major region subdomain 2 [Penicillium brevicompactum]
MLQALGGSVPPNTDHAVSVSLPTWRANVGYEEGEDWVMKKMVCGYPRFFVHPTIQKLAQEIVRRTGNPDLESATLFASIKSARICHTFVLGKIPADQAYKVRIVNFIPSPHTEAGSTVTSSLSCVIYPKEYAPLTKQVWQHSGNGISSRRGEFCLGALEDGFLVEDKGTATAESISQRPCKGPRRYQSKNGARKGSVGDSPPRENTEDGRDYAQFIEERFGRNLSTSLATQAKQAVRKRIAGVLTADVDLSEALAVTSSEGRVAGISEEDVLLYPSGMNAIFNAHQTLLATRGELPSICFGFPYTDTLKILQKWGPGCQFYGHGSSEDLDDLEARLKSGERFLGLFTEAPGNPLLKTPDLKRIRALADQYGFAVVVDETISNFLNINILPLADIVVSSLTKIFSGDSNVMGGSAVLNPNAQYYAALKQTYEREYEDIYWAEDAVFLERNSRDFVTRIEQINSTTENITAMLKESPLVKEVYYPKYSPTRPLYDSFRTPNGGYGGLFSVTFHSNAEAIAFYDTLEVLKGPSLGTNFTLSSPYVLLAHYGELDWARSFNVDPDLVRISVGLEEVPDLRARFQRALDAVQSTKQ